MNIARDLNLLVRHLLRRNAMVIGRAKGLRDRERNGLIEHQETQARLLRESVESARRRIPFYQTLPSPPDGRAIFDWLAQNCPIVSKPDLVQRRQVFYPNAGRQRLWWPVGRTSGTSGAPLEVFRSLESVTWEEAFHLQFWRWAGFELGDPQAVLRGDAVVPTGQTTPPFWRWDSAGRQLYLSTRHLNKQSAKAMVEAVRASGAFLLRAYPSAGYEFARLCEENGVALPLRAVVTGSEPLYPLQREQFERAFACKVFDFYGMAERVAFAAQCEHGHYHLHPEYSFVEILNEAGEATDDFGFIVGSTFHNSVMPLLRYRTQDRARWVPGDCPCGRQYPRIELSSGKVEDQLFDVEGDPVSASVITFAFKGLSNIRKAQVAQLSRSHWVVRIVPEGRFEARERQAVLHNMVQHVSQKLEVSVQIVEDIPLMKSGKFKWVSQECAELRQRSSSV